MLLKKIDRARERYGDDKDCYVYPYTLEDELDETLSLKDWDNWGYDIKILLIPLVRLQVIA